MRIYRSLGLITLIILLIGITVAGYHKLTAQPGITVTLEDPVVQKRFKEDLIEHRIKYVHPAGNRFVVDAPSIDQFHKELLGFYSWSQERLKAETAK